MSFTKKIFFAAALIGGFVGSSGASADIASTTLHNNSFQESAGSLGCPSNPSDACSLEFYALKDATTLITAVSCYLQVTPGTIVGLTLGADGGADQFFMPTFVYGVSGNRSSAATNSQVNMFFKKGQIPYVIAVPSNGGSIIGDMACTITGYHT